MVVWGDVRPPALPGGTAQGHCWHTAGHTPPPPPKKPPCSCCQTTVGGRERGRGGGGGGWGGSAVLDQKQPPHYRPAPNTVFLSWAQRCGARAGLMRARHDGKCVCERSGCAQTAPVPMIPSDVTQFACFLEPRPYSSDQCKTCTWDTQPCV